MKRNNLVIGIYYHPEAFPPTLNAIGELCFYFDKIGVVYRPNVKGNWEYPNNVEEIPTGSYLSAEDQEKSGLLKKIAYFITFCWFFLKTCVKSRPSTILVYDTMALLAYRLISPFLLFKHQLWYHNHDISEIARTRKYSIGWFACKTEQRIFHRIDFFTLPTEERLRFFPMEKFSGKYLILPNYPARKVYDKRYLNVAPSLNVRLLFQGRISEGHGLSEIIDILPFPVLGQKLYLVLKGYCDEKYKSELLNKAASLQVDGQIEFIGFTPYNEVPAVTTSCHIGIAIFSKLDVMNVTLGKASNKIYEYAAAGLPVIYLAESGVAAVLKEFSWAIPVKLDSKSLTEAIDYIVRHYVELSKQARSTFFEKLNYEHYFRELVVNFGFIKSSS